MEIIAHRGSSRTAPENTLAAVELAWQEGADAVEVDVWRTKDGRIAVIHDATTRRVAGRGLRVACRTWEELCSLDCGRWKGRKWAGQRIPCLEDVLATLPEGKRLFVEVKCGPEIVPELQRLLAASGERREQVVFISFDAQVLEEIKERMPEQTVYWLCKKSPRRSRRSGRVIDRIEQLIEKCKRWRFDGLDLARTSALTPENVVLLHEHGLRVFAWTVNSPRVARRLAAAQVDGVTTDRPGWIRERLMATRAQDPKSRRRRFPLPSLSKLRGKIRPPRRKHAKKVKVD